ncbi:unnamed protein product [Chrysoparadoxa australica]
MVKRKRQGRAVKKLNFNYSSGSEEDVTNVERLDALEAPAKKKALPARAADPEESDGELADREEEEGDSDEESQSEAEGEEEEEEEEEKVGGMGDVMARILSAKVGKDAPVLAKRKTKAMKEIESAAQGRSEIREKRAERKAKRTKQMRAANDPSCLELERSLKKVATRGVVALFNAISKHAREREEVANEKANSKGKGKEKGKDINKAGFLSMLKEGTKKQKAPGKQGASSQGQEHGESDEKDAGESSQWSVLKGDYMLGATSTKAWDQESESDGGQQVGASDSDSGD